MRKIAFALVCCVLILAGCGKKKEKTALHDDYVCEPVRIATAYMALMENPGAVRTLLIGEGAKGLEPYLTRAGARCSTALKGPFDLIVADCARMTKRSFETLRGLLAPKGIVAWMLDVRNVSLSELHERISVFELHDVHLWMPGQDHWLLVGCAEGRRIGLSAMLELFAREGAFADLARARSGTLPELFAGYAGAARDFAPAFAGKADVRAVKPEHFLTQTIPQVDWIAADGVDADILKSVTEEIRSLQIVRRLAVEGGMLMEQAGADKNAATNGIALIARAAARNPNDLFVIERLDRLDRNARGFLGVGKILLAMKCYETMVLIQPLDAAAVHNFGMCLKKIGKGKLADEILQRAENLAGGVEKAVRAVTNEEKQVTAPLPSGSRYR